MKKFRIAALMMCFVALSMAFTSCQKNEDLIVGKWKCTEVSGSNSSVNAGVGAIWEFKADNTVSLAGISAATYTVDGDDLTITVSMMGASVSTKMDIQKLNKKIMILAEDGNEANTATFERQ
ncbi:MAG: lipocalin family protein [Bacteroidales bacterium]|nr:lipocalin family protein [Bacteroidales bacterium]